MKTLRKSDIAEYWYGRENGGLTIVAFQQHSLKKISLCILHSVAHLQDDSLHPDTWIVVSTRQNDWKSTRTEATFDTRQNCAAYLALRHGVILP